MKLNLIRELHDDHILLMQKLDRIRGQGSFSPDARALLIEVRKILIDHSETEERDFYPVMRKAAEKNASLQNVLKIMGLEMETISMNALMRIDTWLSGEDTLNFMVQFDAFYIMLSDRIKREEYSLYSKYLKLTSKE